MWHADDRIDVRSVCLISLRSLKLLPIEEDSPALAGTENDYPNKYIRLILPFPPGGGVDTLARILGSQLKTQLGQQIIIDNRPGADGNVATMLAAKAAPDGYALLLGFTTELCVNPALYPDLSVNVEKAFEPITLLAESAFILAVNPSLPVQSVKDLIAYAKAHPGKLNFSSGGIGSPLHLAAALFALDEGLNIVHLPFKGGAPAVLAVLNGEAQMIFASPPSSLAQIRAGKLRPLAVTGLKRSRFLPDLPTMNESGLPGFDVTSWQCMLAPAGTPKAIINTLRDNLLKAIATPDVQKSMEHEGLTPLTSTPVELSQRITAETAAWAEAIKRMGLKPR